MYLIENRYKEIYPNDQMKNYKNRVKLLNPNTPGNLSLHISALTTEDQGHYQCFVSSQQVVAFRLIVLHTEEKPRSYNQFINTSTITSNTRTSSTSTITSHTPVCFHFSGCVFCNTVTGISGIIF